MPNAARRWRGVTLSAVTDRVQRGPFIHEALLYSTPTEFLEGTLAFIHEGLDGHEPVLVVLSAEKIARLTARLGRQANRVQWKDMAEVGANPARIIPEWRRFADACIAAGGPFRGVGEPIWADRPTDELVECQRHEALLNLAFADATNFRLLCPYDTTTLGADVLREAFRSHPIIIDRAEYRPSELYVDLTEVAAPFDAPLPPPPDVLVEMTVTASSLAEIRRMVARQARAIGLSEGRIDDLVVAVNEITSNTVRHGGGHGTLRIWVNPDSLICEVADRGHIDDPMAGRVEPPQGEEGGRGLWMATQLCDLVQVRSFSTGSVVRMHMHADR